MVRTPTIVEERLSHIESMLAHGSPLSTVMQWLRNEQRLSPRQSRHYVASVFKRWSIEAASQGRDEKKNRIRAAAWAAYERGMESDGETRAAIAALELLCRLDGLLEQTATVIGAEAWADNAMVVLHKHYYGDTVIEAKESSEVVGLPADVPSR